MPYIITSKKEGFRRAGLRHSRTPATYPDDALTDEQIEAIRADSMLTIEYVEPVLKMETEARPEIPIDGASQGPPDGVHDSASRPPASPDADVAGKKTKKKRGK